MAHCPIGQLDDLRDLLEAIRNWPGVHEPRRGIFYLRRTPFLHFHINREGRRWADARVGRSWGTEIEIPFRTLNFDPNSDTWGINVQRDLSRKNENSVWMGWARNQGVTRMTNAGRLTGLTNVTQGRGLDVKPYLLGSAQDC